MNLICFQFIDCFFLFPLLNQVAKMRIKEISDLFLLNEASVNRLSYSLSRSIISMIIIRYIICIVLISSLILNLRFMIENLKTLPLVCFKLIQVKDQIDEFLSLRLFNIGLLQHINIAKELQKLFLILVRVISNNF